MANTVTLLSYANTFGDWVVTTNKLAQENNDLAANNYVKSTGTLFLNSPTLGLQVANNAVIQGQLQVSGIGSSAYIQKNLQVDGSIVTTGNNYILANDNNAGLTISQSSTGLAIRINSQPGGSGTFGANSTVVDANGNVYIGSASAGTFKLNVANGNVNFAQNLTVGSNVTSQIVRTTNHIVSKDVTASANVLGDRIQANTNIISPTLSVSGTAFAFFVQANNSVNTETLSVTSSATVNNLTSNNNVWASNIVASSIVGSSSLISNTIQANTSITTSAISSSSLNVSSVINAQTADLYIDDIIANTASIQGNFIINGDIVYNTDLLIINSDAVSPQNGTFASARGPGNANAEIRWNETFDYWDIRDVNNPTNYSRILTANLISDSLTSTSSNTITSSRAGSIVSGNTIALQSQMLTMNANNASINTIVHVAFAVANTGGGAQGNTIALQAQMTTTNTNIASINTLANAAFGRANAESTINNTQNTWITNTNTLANAAFAAGNTNATNITNTNTLATAAYGKANAEGTINTTQNTWITNTNTKMEAAYAFANTRGTVLSVSGTGSANGLSLSGTVTSTGSLTLSGSIPFPVSGAWFQGIPRVNTDGVTEIGRYIDFHTDDTGSSDWDVRMDCTGTDALTFGTAEVTSAAFNTTSDINKKDKVQTIENSLEKVLRMRGVSFEWKENKRKSMGVIAQEIEPIVPEIVRTDGNGTKTVSYDSIIGILIEAIKELKAEVDSLKGDNK